MGAAGGNCWNHFHGVFFWVLRIFFSLRAERFTSTHETLIVGQSVLLSSTSGPPEDFKVKAHINQQHFNTKGCGFQRRPSWRRWIGLLAWLDLSEFMKRRPRLPGTPEFSQHTDSDSDSLYSWICSWHGHTSVSPESPHVLGGRNALMCAQFRFSLLPPGPSLHPGKFNVIQII